MTQTINFMLYFYDSLISEMSKSGKAKLSIFCIQENVQVQLQVLGLSFLIHDVFCSSHIQYFSASQPDSQGSIHWLFKMTLVKV